MHGFECERIHTENNENTVPWPPGMCPTPVSHPRLGEGSLLLPSTPHIPVCAAETSWEHELLLWNEVTQVTRDRRWEHHSHALGKAQLLQEQPTCPFVTFDPPASNQCLSSWEAGGSELLQGGLLDFTHHKLKPGIK